MPVFESVFLIKMLIYLFFCIKLFDLRFSDKNFTFVVFRRLTFLLFSPTCYVAGIAYARLVSIVRMLAYCIYIIIIFRCSLHDAFLLCVLSTDIYIAYHHFDIINFFKHVRHFMFDELQNRKMSSAECLNTLVLSSKLFTRSLAMCVRRCLGIVK